MRNKKLIAVLKICLSIAALFFVFTKIDISTLISTFSHIGYLLMILALVLFVFSKLMSAIRLNLFFKSIGLVLGSKFNLKLYLLGMYYNLFLPGGIGGDGYKIWILSKNSMIRPRKIFWAVLLDRLTGMMALFCLAVALSLFIEVKTSFPFKIYVWVLIPVAILSFYLLIRRYFPDFTDGYKKTTFQAFVVQILQILSAAAIFLSLGGSGGMTTYLFLFLISSIVASLPITIGGVGSREIVFLYGSQILGLDQNLSIALSLAFYFITAFTSFWGIIFSFGPEYINPMTDEASRRSL